MHRHRSQLIVLAFIGVVVGQQYDLVENCQGRSFLDCFTFFSDKDPTNGFVDYLTASDSLSQNLVSVGDHNVTIRADSTHTLPASSSGRPSVRLEARNTYTHALYLLSLNHMPFGCGTWPAFWTLGPDWPHGGEIDIIEGVNLDPVNWATLHTSDNCTVAGSGQYGTLLTDDCSTDTSTSGCVVEAQSPQSYGHNFNTAGGGIYAMQWTPSFIRIWFFPHTNTPTSIRNGSPNPAFDFGTPMANFAGSCNMDDHFHNHRAVLDMTFCGDWAGNTFRSAGCPMLVPNESMASCEAFVAERPEAFSGAYWDVNYMRVYQTTSPAAAASDTHVTSVTPVASTRRVSSASDAMGKSSSSSRKTLRAGTTVPTTTHAAPTSHLPQTHHPSTILGPLPGTTRLRSSMEPHHPSTIMGPLPRTTLHTFPSSSSTSSRAPHSSSIHGPLPGTTLHTSSSHPSSRAAVSATHPPTILGPLPGTTLHLTLYSSTSSMLRPKVASTSTTSTSTSTSTASSSTIIPGKNNKLIQERPDGQIITLNNLTHNSTNDTDKS